MTMKKYYWVVALQFLLGFNTLVKAQSAALFDSEELLTLTLSGNIGDLLKDRTGDPQYFPMTLAYEENGNRVAIPIKARTRGNFRRLKANCNYPPILLNFSKEDIRNTLFDHQDKIKLVTPCRAEDYVVREFLVYKLYNLVTPKSIRARLVKVSFDDSNLKPKEQQPFYAILLEDEDQMAARNGMVSLNRELVRPEQTQAEDFLNMAVFEYMIGNTDWSVQYRQNVKLIVKDTLEKPSTVPYDFDHAGIVGASYARPAEALQMSSTRERRYRGFCISDMNHYNDVINHYNQLKESFYAVYSNCTFIDQSYIKSTLKYLDDFYKTLNDPKKLKSEFQYPCREDGTGNVVIKGLNKN